MPLLVFLSWKLPIHEERLSSAERTRFAFSQRRSSAKRYKPFPKTMTMKNTFCILILLIFCSCNSQNKIERENEPSIYSTSEDDSEMNNAIEKAKSTFNQFRIALKSKNPNYDVFALKKPFIRKDGSVEHIWLNEIQIEGNKYFGVINNLPYNVESIKIGQRLEIDPNEISDWMFLDNSVLNGGYTIRVFYNRMSQAEKKAFENENSIIIK